MKLGPIYCLLVFTWILSSLTPTTRASDGAEFDRAIRKNGRDMLEEGQHTFRFDTFGDESFWGDALKLHTSIAGEKNGGVGPGVSPKTALAVGLKVDLEALPHSLRAKLRAGKVNLDDPADCGA